MQRSQAKNANSDLILPPGWERAWGSCYCCSASTRDEQEPCQNFCSDASSRRGLLARQRQSSFCPGNETTTTRSSGRCSQGGLGALKSFSSRASSIGRWTTLPASASGRMGKSGVLRGGGSSGAFIKPLSKPAFKMGRGQGQSHGGDSRVGLTTTPTGRPRAAVSSLIKIHTEAIRSPSATGRWCKENTRGTGSQNRKSFTQQLLHWRKFLALIRQAEALKPDLRAGLPIQEPPTFRTVSLQESHWSSATSHPSRMESSQPSYSNQKWSGTSGIYARFTLQYFPSRKVQFFWVLAKTQEQSLGDMRSLLPKLFFIPFYRKKSFRWKKFIWSHTDTRWLG